MTIRNCMKLFGLFSIFLMNFFWVSNGSLALGACRSIYNMENPSRVIQLANGESITNCQPYMNCIAEGGTADTQCREEFRNAC